MIQGDTYKFICYLNAINTKGTALGLYTTSCKFFKEIVRVADFKVLKDFVDLAQAKVLSPEETFAPGISRLTDEALMDQVKLGICFENYLKGALLEKGYLVHEIKAHSTSNFKAELKEMRKEQLHLQKPIKIIDYLQFDEYDYEESSKQNTLKSLSQKTLNYSLLLETSEYQDIIQLEPEVREALSQNRKMRNTLHFLGSSGSSYGQSTLKEWELLIRYVNNYIISAHNRLIDDLGFPKFRREEQIIIPS